MRDYERFLTHVKKIDTCTRIWKRLDFDRQCCAPKSGLACCGEDAAQIFGRIHELRCDPGFLEIMKRCLQHSKQLTSTELLSVRYQYELYEREKNNTVEFTRELSGITGAAFDGWVQAKEKDNYNLFAPHLKKVIEVFQRSIRNRDKEYAYIYDACLSDYERGSTVERMDVFFEELREKLCPVLAECRLLDSLPPVFRAEVPIEMQRKLSLQILEAEGLDLTKVSLMETKHPFTQLMNHDDVRITTRFQEHDFISNLYTILHEGGHAVHYMNLPEEFYENGMTAVSTFGMQECISRFYENVIGRSEAFCQWIAPLIQEYYLGKTDTITAEQLFSYVNAYRIQPIRMEADEISYCMHILIRYELEKSFMNGDISVSDIPVLWNEKYRQYLGIEVQNDKEGVLQDVHWTDSIGYFPSYALGSVAAAQLFYRMREDFDVYEAVRSGQLYKVKEWLIQNAFHTSMASDIFTWIRKVTEKELSVDYFVLYLKEKLRLL
ncbi:MAG: carboxypeptidase M32 [Lachnospiraceae bacterium]|nr:carboxypeptidase M32 [Lachnospiraceae bacterium]